MSMIIALAMMGHALVIARAAAFCLHARRFRIDDRVEVGFVMAASVVMLLGFIALCILEPWRLEGNSLAATLIVGQSLFATSYVYHRIDSIHRGRQRRQADRRHSEC